MEIRFGDKEIIFDKELNLLDRFVLDFVKVLEKHCKYVIISGYIPILFGRLRATEDIDIFIEKISEEVFAGLFRELTEKGYWFLQGENIRDLHNGLKDKTAVRIAIRGQVAPNFEIKFTDDDLDYYSLGHKIKVRIGEDSLYISPLELNTAYKLRLGSDKDIEDAKFLFHLFRENLNRETFNYFLRILKVGALATRYLQWKK